MFKVICVGELPLAVRLLLGWIVGAYFVLL